MKCKILDQGTTQKMIMIIKRRSSYIVQVLSILLFFASFAWAESVTSNNDNKINLYGTIKQYFIWGNGNYSPGYPANTAINNSSYTTFNSYMGSTTLGLDIKQDKISANIESDFEGDSNTLILLKAYFSYKLSDKLSLLIGQDDPIGELNTFSDNYYAMPGFDKTRPEGVSQIRVSGNFDFNNFTISPELAIENIVTYMFRDEEQEEQNLSVKYPGIGMKLSSEFNFLKQKGRLYGFFETQKVYFGNNENHWPYITGLGLSLPFKSLTLQSEFLYGKGSTNYVGLIEAINKLGIETEVPQGYTPNGRARRLRAYNIEANLTLSDQYSIYGGYDKLNFMNALINGHIQSSSGSFIGVAYNLTKSTTLKLEYDHFKTHFYEDYELRDASGNQTFLSVQYDF